MDIEAFREFCLSLPDVSEEFPFGPETLVYKVGGKVFAITGLDMFTSFNVKCDPEEAEELRERYAAVKPGFHMNKKHWNTIEVDNSVSDTLLREWIGKSYDLVKSKLPRKRK